MERLNRYVVWGGLFLVPTSLLLGYAGYRSLESASMSGADAAFGAIQLFVLETPTDLTEPPIALNIARFTAPLSLVLATAAALLALLGQQIRRASLRWRAGGHIVIVGLSETSADLLRSLRAQGTTVVVVESNTDHPLLSEVEDWGAISFVGDGRQPDLLKRCRVGSARHVVVTAGQDPLTLEICEVLTSLVGDGTTIYAAIRDESLWSALGRIELEQRGDRGAALEFFNIADRQAMTFIDFVEGTLNPRAGENMHFVGDGDLAHRVLLRWCQRRLVEGVPFRVHVSPEVDVEVIQPLQASHPWITPLIDVSVHVPMASCAVALVVSERSDGHALSSALRIAAEREIERVFVCSTRYAGRTVLDLKGLSSKVRLVPAGAAFLEPATFFSQSWLELMARGRHEDYCANERARGVSVQENASLIGWDELPESLRDSNRRFAMAVGGLLATLGARLAPLTGPPNPCTELSRGEHLEQLAREEHDRWMVDLRRDGWQFHPGPKDPQRKTHPLLVPWEELEEVEREKDREAIRAIPRMLARVGYRLEMPTID